jgi:phosphoglycolate phosphatase
MNLNQIILIFDFDGTIADTLAFTINSASEISRKLKLLNEEKVNMEKFRSMDSREFFKELEIPTSKLLWFMFKYQRKLVHEIDDIKTFEGLDEVLHVMKNNGVKLGIVTSNSKRNVKKFLRKNNLEYFDFVYSSLNYFRKDKMLKKAIEKFQMNKENVIYVGDEVRDIKAAKSIGIKVASVTWGYNFESVLSEYKPDFLIYRPKDLLNLINS